MADTTCSGRRRTSPSKSKSPRQYRGRPRVSSSPQKVSGGVVEIGGSGDMIPKISPSTQIEILREMTVKGCYMPLYCAIPVTPLSYVYFTH